MRLLLRCKYGHEAEIEHDFPRVMAPCQACWNEQRDHEDYMCDGHTNYPGAPDGNKHEPHLARRTPIIFMEKVEKYEERLERQGARADAMEALVRELARCLADCPAAGRGGGK